VISLGLRKNFQCGEAGQLVAGAAIEGLQPQLINPLIADGIDNAFAIGCEAEPAALAGNGFQYSNDLPGVCIPQGDIWFLYLEVLGSQEQPARILQHWHED
jgi:hypothetical protein